MPLSITIISGVTASGKTAEALRLARLTGAEIISCDSVQVYRGMDIGSAKPSKEEMAEIPHHLIDVAEPSEPFNVSEYISMAKRALEDICSRGNPVIISGGSGFYLKSWFSAVTDNIKISDSIREKVASIVHKGGVEALSAELLKIDPMAYKSVDMLNPRRVSKALERCMQTGRSVADILADFKRLPCPYGELDRKFIMVERSDEEIEGRIRSRTSGMISSGLIEETEALLKRGILKNPSAAGAIGYRETIEWLASNLKDEHQLYENIVRSTLALVKKQKKFLRNNLF